MAWLKEIHDKRLHVIEMWKSYGWSNALNKGAMEIQFHNVGRSPGEKIDYIFNVSNEAEFRKEDVLTLRNKLSGDASLGVVGVTWLAYKPGAKDTRIELGKPYRHPRNTGMMKGYWDDGRFV